jgi:uncharacterized protein
MIPVQRHPDGFTLPVRVTPRAGRNGLESFQTGDTVVRIKVTDAPEDGKANKQVVDVLSQVLKIRKTAIVLMQGATARHKVFKITSETPAALLELLAQALEQEAPSGCFTVTAS